MKNNYILLLAILVHGLIGQAAIAQNGKEALVPLPSIDDFTKGKDGFALGIGVGVEYESAYEGSNEFGFEIDPAGALQWRTDNNIIYWAGEALGWRGVYFQRWLFDASVGMDEGREESDSDNGHLKGLGDGEENLELVLQVRHAFNIDWRYWLDGRIVTGNKGNLGLLAVGYRFGDQLDGTGHEFSLAVVLHDSKYANKDFGISSAQSLSSGLKQTNLNGGFRSIGFNYNFRHYITKNWQLFSEAVYEGYSSDVKSSPIARNDYEAELGVGLIYIF
jgi:MipA family protein